MEPKLLLLDEPLSNLDAKLRERMRFELKRLQRELQADHRLRDPRSERGAGAVARDRGDERRPHRADRHAARHLRASAQPVRRRLRRHQPISSMRTVTAPRRASRLCSVAQTAHRRRSSAARSIHRQPGDEVVISLRPEDVHVSTERPASAGEAANVWKAWSTQKIFLGDTLEFQVKVGRDPAVLRECTRHSRRRSATPSLRRHATREMHRGSNG